MGDGLKISKDKRHRSSSSLAAVALEGTRSERKLDKNGQDVEGVEYIQGHRQHHPAPRHHFRHDSHSHASIPELEDQFSIAEVRCDNLQEKIDLIKTLKRKKKLKKRSTTKMTDPPKTPENVPFITVRTQPKKKVSQQAARLRRLEIPPNPTRGYLDPATVEQHQMIGQVRGYNHTFKHPHQEQGHFQSSADHRPYLKLKRQRSHADGDSMCSQSHIPSEGLEVACGQDDIGDEFTNFDVYKRPAEYSPAVSGKKPVEVRQAKQTSNRRRHVPKEVLPKEERVADHWRGPQGEMPSPRRRQPPNKNPPASASQPKEERPVVELFNKNRIIPASLRRQGTAPMITAPMIPVSTMPVEKKLKKVRNTQKFDDECHDPLETMQMSMEPKHESTNHPRRVKYRSRRYEMPTVASQMKQAGMRSYYDTSNHTNIPFVVSKSTAPSHNIGVNIQQVLNGLKIQQPLSGIPLTIAHHMGLGHVPKYGSKSTIVNQQPSLDHHSEINAIRVGRRLVRLPSYKYISYNRLLNLYREGDGMVPRFLRAIARPHYFYTSMYNLATNREDFDCATSKGRAGSHHAKQSLAEYASLYREYEHIDKCIREGNCEPELERRKEELTKELAAREEHIRRVVQEYRTGGEPDQPLRASASTAEDGYRRSTFMVGDNQQ